MAAKPEREPGEPGRFGEPLQRHPRDHVPETCLEESDHQDLADSVDRLQGDVDLVTSPARAKYEGDPYDHFANELAKYGYAVLKSRIAKKIVFERCKQKGFGLRVLDRDFTQQEIEALANYTAVVQEVARIARSRVGTSPRRPRRDTRARAWWRRRVATVGRARRTAPPSAASTSRKGPPAVAVGGKQRV